MQIARKLSANEEKEQSQATGNKAEIAADCQ